jgi:UDP-N-acetylenolpyruvoylglucosamine reductase
MLKGVGIGGLEVSHMHANYIVTKPGATKALASDLRALILLIKERVEVCHGVKLVEEVVFAP